MEQLKSSPRKVLFLVLVAAFLIAGFFIVRRFPSEREQEPTRLRTFNELSPADQKALLESISAPGSGDLSAEKKKEYIKETTAPSSPVAPQGGMQDIINSLTVPSQ